ncbi:EamA-like transporter family protein [Phycisphaerae bacterium RAS1]|nr:EamA-like transporter family protein [Phycisphaerae bacterium RAS1]
MNNGRANESLAADVVACVESEPIAASGGDRVAALNVALLVGYVAISSFTPLAARDALIELPPVSTGVIRFAIASALLLAVLRVWRSLGGSAPQPIAREDYGRFLLAALLCVPLNQFCFLTGVSKANASHAGLMYALNPVLVYMLTLLLGQATWSARMAAAALLAFGGAGVLAVDGLASVAGRNMFVGDMLLLGAVATWSVYSVVVIPLGQRYGTVRAATYVMVLGVLLYAPAALLDAHRLDVAALSGRALRGFLFIAIATSFVNYMLWFVALTRMDVNRLSVAANAAPVFTVILAHQLRDEPLTSWLLAGAALIMSAISLANWPRLRALLRR